MRSMCERWPLLSDLSLSFPRALSLSRGRPLSAPPPPPLPTPLRGLCLLPFSAPFSSPFSSPLSFLFPARTALVRRSKGAVGHPPSLRWPREGVEFPVQRHGAPRRKRRRRRGGVRGVRCRVVCLRRKSPCNVDGNTSTVCENVPETRPFPRVCAAAGVAQRK